MGCTICDGVISREHIVIRCVSKKGGCRETGGAMVTRYSAHQKISNQSLQLIEIPKMLATRKCRKQVKAHASIIIVCTQADTASTISLNPLPTVDQNAHKLINHSQSLKMLAIPMNIYIVTGETRCAGCLKIFPDQTN